MGSILNIVGCSAALLCHFVANPTAHPKYREVHRVLLNSLRDTPREIPLRNLRQLEGHCHTFTIEDDLPDDATAASTIALFEDGKSLPRWHFRNAKKIAEEGRGAYLHVGRTIYFATSDNSSPLSNGRKYMAIHTPSVEPSTSVDVACENLKRFENAVVLQADIGNLPFKPNSFDIISSIGVLHHTPDTKEYTRKLVPLLKEGGLLAIWLYSLIFTRRKQWIPLTSALPHAAFHDWCGWIIQWLRAEPENPLFRHVSILMPLRHDHPIFERAVLALFDGYTPVYHGVHSPEEVVGWFEEFGFTDIKREATETSVSGRKAAR